MRVYRLRTYDLPDVGDYLIHFTGRDGQRMGVGSEISALSPADRLLHILVEGRVRAFPTFGTLVEKNGGPVLYVRGDEWETARRSLPRPLATSRF